MGKKLVLKDSLLELTEPQIQTLQEEVVARWNLLEGAFSIAQENFVLAKVFTHSTPHYVDVLGRLAG